MMPSPRTGVIDFVMGLVPVLYSRQLIRKTFHGAARFEDTICDLKPLRRACVLVQ
jgi:hypothetical protein